MLASFFCHVSKSSLDKSYIDITFCGWSYKKDPSFFHAKLIFLLFDPNKLRYGL